MNIVNLIGLAYEKSRFVYGSAKQPVCIVTIYIVGRLLSLVKKRGVTFKSQGRYITVCILQSFIKTNGRRLGVLFDAWNDHADRHIGRHQSDKKQTDQSVFDFLFPDQ